MKRDEGHVLAPVLGYHVEHLPCHTCVREVEVHHVLVVLQELDNLGCNVQFIINLFL